MNVLALNCGSSSVKFKVADSDSEIACASGLVEEIGSERARLLYEPADGKSVEEARDVPDHETAVRLILSMLTDPELGVLPDLTALHAVGHRVVHGGAEFRNPVTVDDRVIDAIRDCVRFAPLHNPHNLRGIEVALEALPDIPHVAVFDTAFHQSMPEEASAYALPLEVRGDLGVRRYGFHGISHRYVAETAAGELGRPLRELRMVTCHLGNGASVAAVSEGESVDTSMGMTPLEGLVMGTRCGDLDPAVVLYLMEEGGLTIDAVGRMLNEESGLLGLSGVSRDMREVLSAAGAGDGSARLAVAVFCHRARKYIGAYAAVMGGLDAIAFTAGIGEHEPAVRSLICERLAFLGVELDAVSNGRGDTRIDAGSVPVLVIHTDEELAIVRETGRALTPPAQRQ